MPPQPDARLLRTRAGKVAACTKLRGGIQRRRQAVKTCFAARNGAVTRQLVECSIP